MLEVIKETVSYLNKKTGYSPEVGIILGTGLDGLAREIRVEHDLPYESIPNFPLTTVHGHHGRLLFGELGGKRVVAMQGRFHYYEGHPAEDIIFPVRVMRALGIAYLMVSNASGGVNPDFEIGDLMILTDHINLIPNPLIGKNIDELGPRFPDMSEPYSPEMIRVAEKIAQDRGIKVQKGCYVGVTGPSLETPAEYKYFRIIGGDTVGMSTTPEVIAARQLGVPCFAISVITDLGVPGRIVKVTHEEIKQAAEKAEPSLTLLIRELIRSL